MAATENHRKSPPRDNLVRGVFPADIELRDNDAETAPQLFGHFSVFDQWTEIDSFWEGQFMERIAPGAFKKTIRENRDGMRVLLNHGQDPQLGDKPIAAIQALREDDIGAYYEADLFQSVPDIVMDGLRAKQYGASFRFRVMREEIEEEPKPSEYNPRGLPERTIKEAQVMEFGPVTWGAYPTATAGVRSLTDEFLARQAAPVEAPPSTTATTTSNVITFTAAPTERTVNADKTEDTEAAPPHPDKEDRAEAPSAPATETSQEERKMASIEEMRARQTEIRGELAEIAAENTGVMLDPPVQQRWDQLEAESDDLENRCLAEERRMATLDRLNQRGHIDTAEETQLIGETRDTGTYVTARKRDEMPADVFDMTAYHGRARSFEHMGQLMRDGARQAIERFNYPGAPQEKDRYNAHIEQLLYDDPKNEVAQRMLVHGSPTYRSAYWKNVFKQPLSRDEQQALAAGIQLEQRALSTTDTGGVTVPVQIDPTILPSSSGVINPFRQISRIVQTTSHQWQAVTAADITATYRAQGAVMADNSPTLVAPTVVPQRADAFIPISWEAAQDWTSFEADVGMLISRAKDNVESLKFAVGAGTSSNEPFGVLTSAGTVLGTQTTAVFGTVDLFALFNFLGPLFQANATWLASPLLTSKVRQLTSSTTGPGLWADSLRAGDPALLLGRPIYSASNVGTAGAATAPPVASTKWGIIGDFGNYYAIVDRIGLQTRFIENLFAGNTAGALAYPTGQSGLVAYWRNSANVLSSNAFRTGTIT